MFSEKYFLSRYHYRQPSAQPHKSTSQFNHRYFGILNLILQSRVLLQRIAARFGCTPRYIRLYMYIFNVTSRLANEDPFQFPLWRTINKTGGSPLLSTSTTETTATPRDSCPIISMSFDLDIPTPATNYYSLLSY